MSLPCRNSCRCCQTSTLICSWSRSVTSHRCCKAVQRKEKTKTTNKPTSIKLHRVPAVYIILVEECSCRQRSSWKKNQRCKLNAYPSLNTLREALESHRIILQQGSKPELPARVMKTTLHFESNSNLSAHTNMLILLWGAITKLGSLSGSCSLTF